MKLNLIFLAMEMLIVLSYPFLYVYSKLYQWTRLIKSHATQVRP